MQSQSEEDELVRRAALRPVLPASQAWLTEHVGGGLSTGEGLVQAVRDAVVELKGDEEQVVDPGVDDKRLFAIETEFSRVLKVLPRDANLLGEVVRQAWDSGDLHDPSSFGCSGPARAGQRLR